MIAQRALLGARVAGLRVLRDAAQLLGLVADVTDRRVAERDEVGRRRDRREPLAPENARRIAPARSEHSRSVVAA